MLFHLVPLAAAALPMLRWASRLSVTGDSGVDLFFMLSGFVLSYSHTSADVFGSGTTLSVHARYYARFLVLRLARIYPVYLAVLLALAIAAITAAAVGVQLNQTGMFGWDFIRNLLMVRGWDLSRHLSRDGPAWSVSREWAAYLAFAFLLLVTQRVQNLCRGIAAAAVCVGGTLAFFAVVGGGQRQLTIEYPLVRVAGEFAAGCFLYRIYVSTEGQRISERLPRVLVGQWAFAL